VNAPFLNVLPVVAALLLVGCAAPEVRSFESADATTVLHVDEERLWYDSKQFDEQLANVGALYPDAGLQLYLQDIVDRLFPEFDGAMRIHPFNSAEPNAFVLPNGSIYFDIGLLARLDNEAQLAAIIGHEGSHFVERHSLMSVRTAKRHMNAAMVFQAATGVPVVGQALAYSSMMGYSRDLEREADELGFRRMAAAGYDISEAARPFERLAREAEALDYDTPVFFSSHPQMEERVASFRGLEAGHDGGGVVAEDLYRARTEPAARDAIVANLERRRPKVVIFLLEQERLLDRYPPDYRYYLGEAYRLRAEPGDGSRAETEYSTVVETCPEFAPPYRALGKIRMQQGRGDEACDLFERYLDLAPDARDRAYVEHYLTRLREDGS
jgi:predicted Zn-dependent protease